MSPLRLFSMAPRGCDTMLIRLSLQELLPELWQSTYQATGTANRYLGPKMVPRVLFFPICSPSHLSPAALSSHEFSALISPLFLAVPLRPHWPSCRSSNKDTPPAHGEALAVASDYKTMPWAFQSLHFCTLQVFAQMCLLSSHFPGQPLCLCPWCPSLLYFSL